MAGDDHAVLAPDKAGFHAWPGPTRLRLWPSSLTVVGGEKDELPRVAQGCEKRFLGPSSDASAGEPSSATVPVRRIYVLEPRQPSLEEAVIVPLLPVQGVRYLLAHRVGTYPLSVRHSASELESLVRLAVSVPVAILHRPEGLETLPAVVRTVCRDVRARVA